MPVSYADRVGDTSTTTGTGTLTLAGSAPAGARTFAASGLATGSTVRYSIASLDSTAWEVGEGVWTSAGATLSRVTVFASSNSGSLVSFAAGTKNVALVMTAADIASVTQAIDKLSVNLTVAANTTTAGWQKVPMTNVVFDSNSIWVGANTRALPKKAGYYWIAVNLRVSTGANALAAIGKNGGPSVQLGTETAGLNCGGASMIYCNGTTDYIEAYIYRVAAASAYDTGGGNNMVLMGPM